MQKAAAKAPQPTKAELKRMRQEKDPNFKAGAAKGTAEQPKDAKKGKEGAKRKTGVGFQEEEAGKGKRQKTATDAAPEAGPRCSLDTLSHARSAARSHFDVT